MKAKAILFTVSILTLIISACGKDSDCNIGNENYFTTIVDSTLYTAEDIRAEYKQDRLFITTIQDDTLRPYFVLETYLKEPGVYLIINPEIASAQYYPGFGLNLLYVAVNGSITITEHCEDSKRVEGTFNIFFNDSGSEIQAKEGVFATTYE